MQKLKNQRGFSAIEAIIILIILAAIGVFGWMAYQNHHKTTATASSPKTNPYATLAPATVPSKAAECNDTTSQPVATGTTVKLTCSNGDLNIAAWKQADGDSDGRHAPVMMTLGYNATYSQVCNAYIGDQASGASATGTEEDEAYMLSAQYYGWHFATAPTQTAAEGKSC